MAPRSFNLIQKSFKGNVCSIQAPLELTLLACPQAPSELTLLAPVLLLTQVHISDIHQDDNKC